MADSLFDPDRDPFDDAVVALEQARREQKNVLFDIGGDWCIWCHRLERFINDHAELAQLRERHFVTVKVYLGEQDDSNEEFLEQLPPFDGVPHLFVYNSKGQLLCSQPTEELEEGESYNFERIKNFLIEWSNSRLTPFDLMTTEELRQRFGRRWTGPVGDGPVLTA